MGFVVLSPPLIEYIVTNKPMIVFTNEDELDPFISYLNKNFGKRTMKECDVKMEDMIGGIVATCIFISFPIIRYLWGCFLNYSLFKKVGWIITPNRGRNLPGRWNTSLLDEIIYKQQKLEIPKEFRIMR